jgi:hypothetical protein
VLAVFDKAEALGFRADMRAQDGALATVKVTINSTTVRDINQAHNLVHQLHDEALRQRLEQD